MIQLDVVVQLWSGARCIGGLRFATTQAAYVESLTDDQVTATLAGLGVTMTPVESSEERRARLSTWPSQGDLDAAADAWTPHNGGVRPMVRVLERAPLGRRLGVAGSVP